MTRKVLTSKNGWIDSLVEDVNQGRVELQAMGGVGIEPLLILNDETYDLVLTKIKYLQYDTYKEFIIHNGLVSGIQKQYMIDKDVAWLISGHMVNSNMVPLIVKIEGIQPKRKWFPEGCINLEKTRWM